MTVSDTRTEFKLKSPPEDGISSVKFGPNSSQFLLVSSWDNSVTLYDIQANNVRMKYSHERPVLDVCFQAEVERQDVKELWQQKWNQANIKNKALVQDPSVPLPRVNLTRKLWCRLNRFRTSAGRFAQAQTIWGIATGPHCTCGDVQTMQHLVDDCPLYSYEGGLRGIHLADEGAISWLEGTVGELETVVGSHDQAIRCIEYSPEVNSILTGSWDSTVKMWDPRTNRLVGNYSQPDKVYTMSLCGEKLVVGTAFRKVFVWDLRNMGYIQQRRESSLKYQTRCIRCFPNKQGYVLSSIEGRVAVEYLDTGAEMQKKKYAFKCHRIKEDGIEKIYPVNAISFHQGYNTFATAGSDGYVNIWDGFNKKRLCQFHRYNTSISSICFSQDGTVLAIACSYMYEDETVRDPIPDNNVFIRYVTDQETKPK